MSTPAGDAPPRLRFVADLDVRVAEPVIVGQGPATGDRQPDRVVLRVFTF